MSRYPQGRASQSADASNAQVVRHLPEHAHRDVVRAHDRHGVLDVVSVLEDVFEELLSQRVGQGLGVWRGRIQGRVSLGVTLQRAGIESAPAKPISFSVDSYESWQNAIPYTCGPARRRRVAVESVMAPAPYTRYAIS